MNGLRKSKPRYARRYSGDSGRGPVGRVSLRSPSGPLAGPSPAPTREPAADRLQLGGNEFPTHIFVRRAFFGRVADTMTSVGFGVRKSFGKLPRLPFWLFFLVGIFVLGLPPSVAASTKEAGTAVSGGPELGALMASGGKMASSGGRTAADASGTQHSLEQAPEGMASGDKIVVFAEPTGQYLVENTLLRVVVTPPDGKGVRSVEISVDGRRVARLKKPPYEVVHDFGDRLEAHEITALAILTDKSRHHAQLKSLAVPLAYTQNVSLVTITVAVRDENGQYRIDLGRERFRVYENGRPQKIRYFGRDAGPLKIALALDCSGSMSRALPALRHAAAAFIKSKKPEDEIQVVRFNEVTALLCPMTTNAKKLCRSMAGLKPGGGTLLWDAVYAAVISLGDERCHKAVLLFTDGRDESKNAENPATCTTFSEAVSAARQRQVPVYAIGLGQEVDTRALQRLSEKTGGRFLAVARPDEIQAAYEKIYRDLTHRYTLSYQSNNDPAPGEWVEIEVRVDDPMLEVHHQQGYISGDDDGVME